MLVFTRTVEESFRIEDDVEILVADTNGVAVKLEVEAPKNIKVNRKEVHERIGTTSDSYHWFQSPLSSALNIRIE